MWCLRAAVCLLFCYGYLADDYVAVGDKRPYFDSKNFKNVLRWDPIEPVQEQDPLHLGGEPVLYSVQYRRDNQPLRPKMECQNITSRSCDLTAEMPPLPFVYYEAQVYANGRTQRAYNTSKTYRFQPAAETILGAPGLSKRVSGPSLHLNVTLPLGPGDTPLLEVLNRTRRLTPDPLVIYTLTITHPSWAVQVNNSLTGRYILTLKNNNTEYCGYVVYRPNFHIGRPPSENASFCVVMRKEPWVVVPWFLMAAGLLVVPVVLSAVLVYLYAHPRKKPCLPQSMQVVGSSSARPSLLRYPEPACSMPVVCPVDTFPIKQKPQPVSLVPRGYFPQCDPCDADVDDLAWEDSSCSSSAGAREIDSRGRASSECQSSTTQSSVSYANVIVNVAGEDASGPHLVANIPSVYRVNDMPREDRVIDEEHGNRAAVKTSNWDIARPFPTVTSHVASLFTDPGDNPGGPLLLPAVRNPKGELTLSMLAFQSQAEGDEEEEEEEEQEPLLVDVEFKARGPPRLLLSLNSMGGSEDWDSGCDQSTANNTPTQLSVCSDGSPTRPAPPAFPAGLRSSDSEQGSGYKQNWFTVGEDTRGYGFGHLPWTRPEVAGEGEEEEQGDGQVFLGGWVVRFQE